jgi:hypothetical protein
VHEPHTVEDGELGSGEEEEEEKEEEEEDEDADTDDTVEAEDELCFSHCELVSRACSGVCK